MYLSKEIHENNSEKVRGMPLKTSLLQPGSRLATSRRSKANAVTRLSTLRKRFKVVSCQLARLRLLPTDQAMKALDTGGRNTTEVTLVQLQKARLPTLVNV